jgi:MFS family permease
VISFVLMLLCFGVGAVLMFINFLALRQAVTPAPMLGRMTSIVRWLMLLGAIPGALLGGYLGEHWGLRYAMGLGGVGALLLAVWAWFFSGLRQVRTLPPVGTD